VDMTPHALRQRMRHGNVYPPDRAQVALDRFFTESNLTALREISLRLVARRVEGQMEDRLIGRLVPLVSEQVLVLVDGGPASARAVRRAASLASRLHGGLIAVVAETPDMAGEPFDRRRDRQEALDDAVDLGAEVIRVETTDVVDALEYVVRARGATHVVLAHAEQPALRRLTQRPLVDRIVTRMPDVEVHVVGTGSRP